MENKKFYEVIQSRIHSLPEKKITLGWDGFSDSIVKVIRTREDQQSGEYFDSIQEFGKYILDKGEKNFSLELDEVTTKIGGNMPIMANALAQLGARPSCIGTMGYPRLNPVFEKMPAACRLYSFANPGITHAMEFNGSKIILAVMGALNQVGWKVIMEVIGRDTLVKLFSDLDLVSLLNWSELHYSTEIWDGLLTDVLPFVPVQTGKPVGFFDLSDCSKKSMNSILKATDLLKVFSNHWQVVLSLNLNEASLVHRALRHTNKKEEDNIQVVGQYLYENLDIDTVVIHYSKEALAWDRQGFYKQESFFLSHPRLSTGAGDNFNAGFCTGLLLGLNTGDALVTGHLTSGFYMEQGRSPLPDEFLDHLQHKMSN